MVSCDTQNMGCDGGYLDKAWDFVAKEGLTTDACYPYESGADGDSRTCKDTCADGSEMVKYKCKGKITECKKNKDCIK